MTPPPGQGGNGDGRDGHRGARYFRVPPRRRRWTSPVVWAVWITLGVVTGLAWASYVFVEETIAQVSPDTERVREARRVADPVLPGQPITILLIGSDSRGRDQGDPGRSDSIILVRLDSQQGFISMLSFPRDSYVEIPGYGEGKINSAYTLGEQSGRGGPALLIETVRQLTGQRVNFYVNVDFKGFATLVDEIGGVYIDVDRRYFNDNSGPEKYEMIDLLPGYQRLFGDDALDFVRYRHNDSDFARIVRQQMFLTEVKRKVRGSLGNLAQTPQFLRLIARNSETSIRSSQRLLDIIRLGVETPDERVHRVTVEGRTDMTAAGESIVVLDDAVVAEAVQEWLNPPFQGADPNEVTVNPRSVRVRVLNGSGRTLVADEMAALLRAKGYRATAGGNAKDFGYERSSVFYDGTKPRSLAAARAVRTLVGPSAGFNSLGTEGTGGSDVVVVVGADFAGRLYTPPKQSTAPPKPDVVSTLALVPAFREAQRRTGMRLMVPTRIARGSEVVDVFTYRVNTRERRVTDGGGGPWAVKVVFRLPGGGIPRYWGITATTMESPPILLGKTGTLRKGDGLVPLDTYYNGRLLAREAFRRDGVTYWVSNTIGKQDALTAETMHSISRSFRPVGRAKLPEGVANTPVSIGDDPSTP